MKNRSIKKRQAPKGRSVYQSNPKRHMPGTSKRGFAAMDPEKQREIASKGGRSSHVKGFATMDPEKQREIARKGGLSSHGGGRKSKSGDN